jgi:hypothetical protein
MCTAMAARRSAMIFDTARRPVWPTRRSRRSLCAKQMRHQGQVGRQGEEVIHEPTDWEMTRSVVIVAGPAMSGMPSGTTPKSSGRLIFSCEGGLDQLARGEDEEDEPARDLEVALADPDGDEDAAPQEQEEERDDAPRQVAWLAIRLRLATGTSLPERQEDRRQPDGVDRDEEGDEALEESSGKIHRTSLPRGPERQSTLRPRAPRRSFQADWPCQGDRPLRPHPARARRARGILGLQPGPRGAPLEVSLPRARRRPSDPPGDPGPRARPPRGRGAHRRAPVALETESVDGFTRKYLLGLADGERIETVLMRFTGRATACVSSQAGCAMGCVFCATGQMGYRRHLTAGEIVAQVVHVARALRGREPRRLRNVVFMGMGEPLHNYDAVMKAADILRDPSGLGLSADRITLSTVGVVPGSGGWPTRRARSTSRSPSTRRPRRSAPPSSRPRAGGRSTSSWTPAATSAPPQPEHLLRVDADRRGGTTRPATPTRSAA